MVLFQAALADILIKEDGGDSRDACAVGDPRFSSPCDGQQLPACQEGAGDRHRGPGRTGGTEAQISLWVRKGPTDPSWANRQGSNSSQSQWRTWSNKNQDEDRVEELSNVVRLLANVVLRHEDEHSRLWVETGFLVYCDTGEHGVTSTLLKLVQAWKAKKEEGKVSTSLRVTLFLGILQILQDKLGELLTKEDQLRAAEKHEWLKTEDRGQGPGPKLVPPHLEPDGEERPLQQGR